MAGRAQINIGTIDRPGAFINFMKGCQSQIFSAGTDPSNLDANGYPNTTLAANIGCSIFLPSGFAGNAVQWVLKWPSTRNIRFTFNTAVTKSTSSGATISGGANSSMTVTSQSGLPGRIVFAFNNYAGSTVSFFFGTGFANGGSGELALIRLSDEAAYDSGKYFTPEFLALLQDLNPKTIRTMGWTHTGGSNFCGDVKWGYRTQTTSVSWCNRQFPPGAWGGTIGGTDTYTVSAAPDTPVSWTGGEVIQGVVTNANTSTTPTLNVNGRGAKTIVNGSGVALSAGTIPAGSLATFMYDDLLDKAVYNVDGITASVPIEAQVALANAIGANLWALIPPMAEDAFVTSWGTYIRDNLSASLHLNAEYGNEMWNSSFPQFGWSNQRGLTLGFPNTNSEPNFGWYGLRFRQIMASLTALWAAAGKTNLKRTLAFQAFGNVTNTQSYKLNGSDLSLSKGYTKYNSYVGVDYSSPPNRPVDYADVLAYASYYTGCNFGDGGTYVSGNQSFMQTLATNYASGDPTQMATALASLDSDIRTGAVTSGYSMFRMNTQIYPAWETVAASYTGLVVEAYEGGLEILAPTAAQCAASTGSFGASGVLVGGSAATASATLTSLATAYKNSPQYQKVVADQFDQFMAQTHSATPSWLSITGSGQWSLLSGDIFSTPFQTYYGFKDYNNRKRRMVW